MAGRNTNGEGTIYRRKDGRWEAAVYAITTSGVSKRIRVYGSTRGEVSAKLLEVKQKRQNGVPIPNKSWRVGEYLGYWLTNTVKPNLRSSTHERYEATIRLHLRPHLGNVRLADLSVPTVQTFLSAKLAEGRSVRNVQIMREVLRAALSTACREELLTRNVAGLVRLPKWEQREIRPWSPQETYSFLQAASSDPLYPAFVLATYYGLRRGEVLGIRWEDIDFEQREIRIRQQVRRTNGQLEVGPLKTKSSRRNLPLLFAVQDALLEQANSRSTDLIFTTANGQPVEPHNFTRSFQRICRQQGIRRIRFHDLRHTAATLLKDCGVPDRDIQLILGHSTITTTQQIYQHDSMESRRTALEKVERLFRRSTGLVDVAVNYCRQDGNSLFQSLQLYLAGETGLEPATPGFGAVLGHPKISRVTEVRQCVQDREKLWLMGAVAVSTAVKFSTLRKQGRVAIALALASRQDHTDTWAA